MDHEFYSLDEAATLLRCEITDLLKWGAADKIDLHIRYVGQDYWEGLSDLLSEINERIPISKEDCMQAYEENKMNPRPGKHTEVTLKYKNHPPMLIRGGPFSLAPDFLYISKETYNDLKTKLSIRPTEVTSTCLEEEPSSPSSVIPAGKILVGWKNIAAHLGVSESTAKRYSKGRGWPRPNPTGRPTTTAAELDQYLLTVSKKKKKKV